MNENSEIKVNNTEKSGYKEKNKDSNDRLYSQIFIIIGIVILVIIAIIMFICFAKSDQLESTTVEDIKDLNL
jgi:heme/copper-type cytochrome/quinol oxidase subunit 2